MWKKWDIPFEANHVLSDSKNAMTGTEAVERPTNHGSSPLSEASSTSHHHHPCASPEVIELMQKHNITRGAWEVYLTRANHDELYEMEHVLTLNENYSAFLSRGALDHDATNRRYSADQFLHRYVKKNFPHLIDTSYQVPISGLEPMTTSAGLRNSGDVMKEALVCTWDFDHEAQKSIFHSDPSLIDDLWQKLEARMPCDNLNAYVMSSLRRANVHYYAQHPAFLELSSSLLDHEDDHDNHNDDDDDDDDDDHVDHPRNQHDTAMPLTHVSNVEKDDIACASTSSSSCRRRRRHHHHHDPQNDTCDHVHHRNTKTKKKSNNNNKCRHLHARKDAFHALMCRVWTISDRAQAALKDLPVDVCRTITRAAVQSCKEGKPVDMSEMILMEASPAHEHEPFLQHRRRRRHGNSDHVRSKWWSPQMRAIIQEAYEKLTGEKRTFVSPSDDISMKRYLSISLSLYRINIYVDGSIYGSIYGSIDLPLYRWIDHSI